MRRRAAAHRHHPGNGQQLFPAQGLHVRHVPDFLVIVLQSQLHCLGKACDLGRGLGAGAQTHLLAAAGEEGAEIPQLRADVQGSNALRSAQLVRR